MPRKTRYAAPTIFTIVNTTTDCATRAPMPSATAAIAGSIPSALPTTLSRPPRLPSAIDRPSTNSTLGPGSMISSTDASTNASRLGTGTMDGRLPALTRCAHGISVDHHRTSRRARHHHAGARPLAATLGLRPGREAPQGGDHRPGLPAPRAARRVLRARAAVPAAAGARGRDDAAGG